MHQRRAGRGVMPAGRKLGFTNRAIWSVFNATEPIWSHVYDTTFQLADCIAACACHAMLSIGDPCRVDRFGPALADCLRDFTVSMACGASLRDRGQGSNVLGSPLAALAHLMLVLANQPEARPIGAGEIVTTGTITAALPIAAGETWRAAFDGIDLPGLTVSFEAWGVDMDVGVLSKKLRSALAASFV